MKIERRIADNNNNIGYNRKGLDANASEESKQVVKDTYLALKKRKKFFNFQLSFNPMQGIIPTSITHYKDYVCELYRFKLDENFCGLRYQAKDNSSTKRLLSVVPFLRNLVILKEMLSEVRYSNTPDCDKIKKQYVVDVYSEDYFKNYSKNHKILPNPLMVSWFIGIALTCIFYVLMIIGLYQLSPFITFSMLVLHASVFGAFGIYTFFNKF